MERTPKSLRLHIALFGRTNVGKSTLLNMIAGQDVSITSAVAGTTTDVVEKTMELLPVGPVVFLDTGGLDDRSPLARARIRKTSQVFQRADVALLVAEPGVWTAYEDNVCAEAQSKGIPVIVAITQADRLMADESFLHGLSGKGLRFFVCSGTDLSKRDQYVNTLKRLLLDVLPDDFLSPPPLVGDLVAAGGILVLVVPIDLEAPKGRLILPQVQVLRDALDHDAAVIVVKEREYASALERLREKPALVVCDSQVVLKMVADTPADVPCTTFSLLLSRQRGDLREAVRGVRAVDTLRAHSRVLIAEACSHHAIEDDIGRVKIPRWLRQYTGQDLVIESCAGKDFPLDLSVYALIVHCGGCMINRREMLFRIQRAREAGVPMTNYGVCISYSLGVLPRVLSPFPGL